MAFYPLACTKATDTLRRKSNEHDLLGFARTSLHFAHQRLTHALPAGGSDSSFLDTGKFALLQYAVFYSCRFVGPATAMKEFA